MGRSGNGCQIGSRNWLSTKKFDLATGKLGGVSKEDVYKAFEMSCLARVCVHPFKDATIASCLLIRDL